MLTENIQYTKEYVQIDYPTIALTTSVLNAISLKNPAQQYILLVQNTQVLKYGKIAIRFQCKTFRGKSR